MIKKITVSAIVFLLTLYAINAQAVSSLKSQFSTTKEAQTIMGIKKGDSIDKAAEELKLSTRIYHSVS